MRHKLLLSTTASSSTSSHSIDLPRNVSIKMLPNVFSGVLRATSSSPSPILLPNAFCSPSRNIKMSGALSYNLRAFVFRSMLHHAQRCSREFCATSDFLIASDFNSSNNEIPKLLPGCKAK